MMLMYVTVVPALQGHGIGAQIPEPTTMVLATIVVDNWQSSGK